jgi:hypothetical protein
MLPPGGSPVALLQSLRIPGSIKDWHIGGSFDSQRLPVVRVYRIGGSVVVVVALPVVLNLPLALVPLSLMLLVLVSVVVPL